MIMKIILLLSFFLITSCSVPNWYKPQGYILFRQMPEGGSPGFNLGWIHGCESGLGSQFGGAIKMTFYTWSKDPDIASSNPDIPKIRKRYKKELKDINWDDIAEVKKNFSDYNTIFWGAHSFCRHSTLQIEQAAGYEPPLPGDERYDPGAHNLGTIWKLNGKGDTRIGSKGLW
jgi:hypothetical protein